MQRKHSLRASIAAALIAAAFAIAVAHPRSTSPRNTAHAASTTTVFAAVGDYGSDSANETAVANLVAGWNPAFIATVGDNFYNAALDTGDTGNKYHESVGKYYCSFLAQVSGAGTCPTGGSTVNRFFPSMGNHDYSDASLATYTGYFTLPGAGVASSSTSGNERYYDFTEGPVEFFMINSNTAEPDGTSSTSRQAQWLQARLAASTATWKVVLFHHAPYSSDSTHGDTTYMQWPFAQWGADAVLAGHSHTFERILRDGIVYFVNGLGGDSTYSFGTPVTGSTFRYNGSYGAQRITATDTALTFDFISTDGVVQDSYQLTAGSPATPTPAATGTPVPTPTSTASPAPTATAPTTTATPAATYIHSGDLDAAAPRDRNLWTAGITVTAHDAAHNPVDGVLVTGYWTGEITGSASCVTDLTGQCTLDLLGLPASDKSVTFAIAGLSKSGTVYDAASDHDPDGDSDGTTITITR